MDQLICASLSHNHYWYEVGMLKVPATIYICSFVCLVFSGEAKEIISFVSSFCLALGLFFYALVGALQMFL